MDGLYCGKKPSRFADRRRNMRMLDPNTQFHRTIYPEIVASSEITTVTTLVGRSPPQFQSLPSCNTARTYKALQEPSDPLLSPEFRGIFRLGPIGTVR